MRFKNISSIDLRCLTDRTTEVYSPVKPLKDEEAIVGLTVERANPDLTLSSKLSSSPSKKHLKTLKMMSFTWTTLPSQNNISQGLSAL
jgi:hypothetical protein